MIGKERQIYVKDRRGELKATMERHYKEKGKEFDECLEEVSLDTCWKLWSEALENGYLEVLTGTTEIKKKQTGRGEITIVEMTPKRKEM